MLFLYNEFSRVIDRSRLVRGRLFSAVKGDEEMVEGDDKWKTALMHLLSIALKLLAPEN